MVTVNQVVENIKKWNQQGITMSANERQEGGDHYKTKEGEEEHWDRQFRMFGSGYFVGSITKYVERYEKKNGIEDLKKARHFIDKLIELEAVTEQDKKFLTTKRE